MKMLSKKPYDLVSEDGYDTRIPLHNDEAFQHGIHFQAKFIGTLDIPRPSSRVEIVAAMRRIRYDHKSKGIKKKKVCLTISVDGIKVLLSKKRPKSLDGQMAEDKLTMMHHPIFRIFYVSHDSTDLKIWSYIARDGPSNVFKCHVFKAFKKSQALRIVRTIGQAFEVCHKISVQSTQSEDTQSTFQECSDSENFRSMKEKDKAQYNNSIPLSTPEKAFKQAQELLYTMAAKTPGKEYNSLEESDSRIPLTTHHHIQLLRAQLEMQQHQTQLAIAQVHLLKDQLAAESAARIEAQARSHQLLVHNRDLLEHMAQLVTTIQELEVKVNGISTATENLLPPLSQLQVSWFPDPTTPQSGAIYTPDGHDFDLENSFTTHPINALYSKAKIDETDSPDSGLKEMSSENLVFAGGRSQEPVYWPSILRGQVSVNTSEGILTQNQFTGIASITGNPFASGFEDAFNQNTILQCSYEERMKIIAPLPSQEPRNNKLELKLSKTPKIDPPPEFRNSKSFRDSQISAQSTDSASSHENCPLMKADSDYHSNTTGSSQSYGNNSGSHGNQNGSHVVMLHNESLAESELFPQTDFTNGRISEETNDESISLLQNSNSCHNEGSVQRQLADPKCAESYKKTSSTLDSLQKLELQINRMNLDQKSASDYCLRTLSNGGKDGGGSFRVKAIPPPPPPRRTESLSSDIGS